MNLVENLPSNIDAEQGLLATIMLNNGGFYDAYGTVKAEDFFFEVHGRIFEAIGKLIDQGKTASPVTLKAYFETDEALKDVGGIKYLVELITEFPMLNTAKDYAEVIAETAQRRNLLFAIEAAYTGLQDGNTDPSEIRADLSTAIENTGKSVFVRTKREVAQAAVESLNMPKKCYKTLLHQLDQTMAGGLYAGFTYGLCAPEKRGKTTFAHTISHNLNQQGIDHAYIALEMGSEQIEQRNLARELQLNSMAFLAEKKSQDLLRRAADAATTIPDHTLYLDMPGSTFSQIKAELTALAAKKKIKGFILDYWQLVGGCPVKQSKADFLYDVAQWTANFARRHGLWNILLSQVNREGKVFGSAGLEKACDQLYFIEKCEDMDGLWLNQTHSRYTPTCSVGGEVAPAFQINTKSGPYIEEV